jgi:putative nucleotidyltransferase with HDIG domain
MKQKSREIDICGRYGGEEFLIITNLLMDNALRYATKLHTAVENHVFECSGKSIRVTVSIGIAEYNSDIKTKQELIERADTAMYQAKMDGRNLIRIWKTIETNDEKSVDRLGIEDLKGKFQDLSDQMRYIYMESTNALIKAVDAKDPFAREHSRNVSEYAKEIAKFMKLSEQDIEIIHYAGLLHDVGKIGIKDDILVKKEELTSNELEILKRHPEVGVNILKDIKFLEKEIPVILHHHERFDGKGYPHGLRGREIPVGARIIAVADAFDAMTSGRTYKTRLPWKKAVDEIKKGSGTQFAPEVVEAFVKLEECGQIAPRSK